jgi:hypothetical protein
MLHQIHSRAWIIAMANENLDGRMLLGIGVGALVAACASHPIARKDLLEFLDQPAVTDAQVREHLGAPCASFEQEHVLAYRLSHNDSGYYVPQLEAGWKGVQYDLIVVLDEHNFVQKHNLVAIRPP